MTVHTTTKCENCGAEIFPEEESTYVNEEEDVEFPLLESKLCCMPCARAIEYERRRKEDLK